MFHFFEAAIAEQVVVPANALAPEITEEVVEEAATWFGMGQTAWICIVTVLMLALLLTVTSLTRKVWNARSIAFAALCLALSFVLRYVKLFEMPNGGSVTLASMLPLMLFAAAYGVGPGMLVGTAYGFLRYMSGGWFAHPVQFLLDYPLAFALIALTGVYLHLPKKWRPWSLYLCMILGALGRCASATVAGVFFWDTAWIPSIIYNGSYLIPDTIICMVFAVPLAGRLLKVMSATQR